MNSTTADFIRNYVQPCIVIGCTGGCNKIKTTCNDRLASTILLFSYKVVVTLSSLMIEQVLSLLYIYKYIYVCVCVYVYVYLYTTVQCAGSSARWLDMISGRQKLQKAS